ncbi:hypothetical protein B0O80DRAFT_440851 [Mortierella sp. GBAus27b]|nr:hypothetical protein B0O80DRAFT_440851 [Mortierella sp. GBAus27b]
MNAAADLSSAELIHVISSCEIACFPCFRDIVVNTILVVSNECITGLMRHHCRKEIKFNRLPGCRQAPSAKKRVSSSGSCHKLQTDGPVEETVKRLLVFWQCISVIEHHKISLCHASGC